MNSIVGSLLKNFWTLTGSIIGVILCWLWYFNEAGWEPLVSLCGAGFVFLSSAYAYIFYEPVKVPRLELSHQSKSGSLPPTPIPYRLGAQHHGKSHFIPITWNYTFFIRNNSTYPAFKVKFHLKDQFSKLQFHKMNQYKPIILYWFKESYLQTVERLHHDEPIKSLEKVGFEAKYEKIINTTRDEAIELCNMPFPDELNNVEILVEYFNEDGEVFFTRFRRLSSNEWENKKFNNKPFDYTQLNRLIKTLKGKLLKRFKSWNSKTIGNSNE